MSAAKYRAMLPMAVHTAVQPQRDRPETPEGLGQASSTFLAASGKSYQNYAAALRIWAGNDKKGAPKKGIPDYSCKEGESL